MASWAPTLFLALVALGVALAYVAARILLEQVVRHGPRLASEVAGSRWVAGMTTVWRRTLHRYPRVGAALAARFDPRRFAGLPLTLMGAAAVYVLLLTGEILEELLEAEELVAVDRAVNRILDVVRGWPATDVFAWITAFGDSQTVVAVSAVMTALLVALARARAVVPLWITLLGALTTTWIGKYVIDRVRPEPIEGFVAFSPAFPSGHATAAAAVYGFLAYLVGRDVDSTRARFEIAFWTATAIGLVGFSRIYLGLHYLSDVLTGFLVGGFWLLVGFIVAERRRGAA